MRKIQFNRMDIYCTASMFQALMGDTEMNNKLPIYNF